MCDDYLIRSLVEGEGIDISFDGVVDEVCGCREEVAESGIIVNFVNLTRGRDVRIWNSFGCNSLTSMLAVVHRKGEEFFMGDGDHAKLHGMVKNFFDNL